MSDCALLLREEYTLNTYAAALLARVSGFPPEQAPETRGPVVLFGWDSRNEWDSRPFTATARVQITGALTVAGCAIA